MRKVRDIKKMSELSGQAKLKKKRIGFVPTMGALHDGHVSLIRQARKGSDFVVVSIFVNPLQFGKNEDFKQYPRNLKKDASICRKEGVDVLFYPEAKQMYPPKYRTFINVEGLSDVLCGKSRPGHFKGVATAVTKLFNIINPDFAYFGSKDAQQAIIIEKMARDLNLPVKIMVMPTVRQKGGLALSSRNVYLSPEHFKQARVLSESLQLAQQMIKSGTRDTGMIINRMKGLIRKKSSAKIDYVAIVDLHALSPIRKVSGDYLIALAVWLGRTRLIDNRIVKLRKRG